jgi:uncharacterized Rmd1/YagE family protein
MLFTGQIQSDPELEQFLLSENVTAERNAHSDEEAKVLSSHDFLAARRKPNKRVKGLPQIQGMSNRRRKRRQQRALKPENLGDQFTGLEYEAFISQKGDSVDEDAIEEKQVFAEKKRTFALEKASRAMKSWRIAAYCFANRIETEKAIDICNQVFGNSKKVNDEVVHVVLGSFDANTGRSDIQGLSKKIRKDIFVFTTFGSVVCWATNQIEEEKVLELMRGAVLDTEKLSFVDSDFYEFSYYIGSSDLSGFHIFRDTSFLPIDLDDKKDLLYKLSCSYALATSGKVGIFEEQIESVIVATEKIPKELADQGKVSSMSKSQVSCIIGELNIYKSSLNLMYDILDAPEFFWDYPELEEVYTQSRKHVEVADRVEVLNKRMQVLSELLSILQDEKSESHSSNLEWIVIWLIVLDVIMGVARILISIYTKKTNK